MSEVLSPPDVAQEPARWRRATYAALLTVVAGVLTAAILNVEPLLSANDRSRWCTIWSLVERGTFQIDEIDAKPAWSTIDKVRHEGHFYSSKPPLLSTLYAGVYWAVKKATGWTLLSHTADVARLMLILTHLLPWLAALAVLCRMVDRSVRSDYARLLIVTTGAFGTLVTAFTVTINNHSLGAASLILSLYSALRVLESSGQNAECGRWRSFHAASAGFFAAFTVTCELPAALYGVLIFLLLLRSDWKRTLFAFAPAALVPLSAYFVTNALATGGWKPFYAFYGTDKYEYVFEGIPSYWMSPKGMDRAVDSPAVYFLHCTIGHHGVLSLTPIWLISLWGWASLRRVGGHPLRPLLAMGMLLNVVVLGFYLSRTANYNYGGNCAGLRWMVWLVPFWLLALAPPAERWGDRLWFRMLVVPLLAISVFSAHASLGNPWNQPWLFTLMQRAGWLKQYAPDPPRAFDRPLTTWFASLPQSGEGATPESEAPWAEWEGVDFDGSALEWRLSIEHSPNPDQASVRLLRHQGGRLMDDRRFTIDLKKFRAGLDPSEFLVAEAGTDGVIGIGAAAILLRGLPSPRAYREGVDRYVRTSLRRDAFACQRAASRVLHEPANSDQQVWHRTDLWLCEETPFGVVRFETTISDAGNDEVIGFRRMTIRDYGPRQR